MQIVNLLSRLLYRTPLQIVRAKVWGVNHKDKEEGGVERFTLFFCSKPAPIHQALCIKIKLIAYGNNYFNYCICRAIHISLSVVISYMYGG